LELHNFCVQHHLTGFHTDFKFSALLSKGADTTSVNYVPGFSLEYQAFLKTNCNSLIEKSYPFTGTSKTQQQEQDEKPITLNNFNLNLQRT